MPNEEPKVEDRDDYEMEVPGDTSNDTCMFEKSEEPHDTQIELDPFAVSTKCTWSFCFHSLQHHWAQPSSSETIIQVFFFKS